MRRSWQWRCCRRRLSLPPRQYEWLRRSHRCKSSKNEDCTHTQFQVMLPVHRLSSLTLPQCRVIFPHFSHFKRPMSFGVDAQTKTPKHFGQRRKGLQSMHTLPDGNSRTSLQSVFPHTSQVTSHAPFDSSQPSGFGISFTHASGFASSKRLTIAVEHPPANGAGSSNCVVSAGPFAASWAT